MFTRMSKGLLIFMEVVFVIASIVGGCAVGGESGEPIAGFLMFLFCLLLSFIILSSFGLFVELANNVLDIKEILEEQNKSYPIPNNSNVNNVPEPKTAINEKRVSLADVAAKTEDERKQQQGWFCSECGTRNPASLSICKACGKEKYGN